jgi:hypothetical protein
VPPMMYSSYEVKSELACTKGHELLSACCSFSDFGTRRRRSYHTQDIVIKSLISATKDVNGGGSFKGTSNVCNFTLYTLITHAAVCSIRFILHKSMAFMQLERLRSMYIQYQALVSMLIDTK